MPHHGLQHKVRKMTETKPLNEDGSPPHREAQTVKLEMEDKMVQIKKLGEKPSITINYTICLFEVYLSNLLFTSRTLHIKRSFVWSGVFKKKGES